MTNGEIPGSTGSGNDSGTTGSDTSGSNSKKSKQTRTVHVNGRFGTRQIKEGTTCHQCDKNSAGVLIIGEDQDKSDMVKAFPLCLEHRDEVKYKRPTAYNNANWETYRQ